MQFDVWGIIPTMLNVDDPRPAAQQLDSGYQHGGGWRPFTKFTFDQKAATLTYPGDPPMRPLSIMSFRDETLMMFESAWVVILQKDGRWEVSRMD